jgi:hypothetical protein
MPSLATGSNITALTPTRVFDTRPGEPAGVVTVTKQPVAINTTLKVKVTGVAGVPSTGVGAVALTITATEPTAAGFITAYPCGPRPLASSLNYATGQTIANTIIVPVNANGEVCFYSNTTTHLVADITAWFAATTT